ncbi:hypothetical protein B0H17DRAFT_1127140 [Mycena rosella]|uniref:Uncharacterized protein n=1 Tax=Mycena rosella TaxID=1033263 RepID=A0AAD7E0C5_MYCRO|nr:hypothetical protein B0H17DRAFT_1127140 [Mycena rosella]
MNPGRRWDNPSPVRHSTAGSSAPTGGPSEADDDLDELRSSSPSSGRTNNPRKRPAEDMTQFAEHTARNLRLKLTSTQALRDYAQMNALQQSLWLAGQMLFQTELLENLQPPEGVYNMSPTLEGYIDQYSFVLLIDPKTSAYVTKGKNVPVDRLTTFLLKVPGSGLSTALVQDKQKMKVIETRMRSKLTNGRNAIKDLISNSLGDESVEDPEDPAARSNDIVMLCQQVLNLSFNKQKDVKVSLEMCGRFAFLRDTYVTLSATPTPSKVVKATTDFWGSVDKDLKNMRAAKSNDEARISQVIGDILADDKKKYGPANLEELIQESPVSMNL